MKLSQFMPILQYNIYLILMYLVRRPKVGCLMDGTNKEWRGWQKYNSTISDMVFLVAYTPFRLYFGVFPSTGISLKYQYINERMFLCT